MKKIGLTIFALFFSGPTFGEESIYGKWQFQINAVYIVIGEDNSAFQCRIAADESTIRAKGQVISGPPTQIKWGTISILDVDGNSIDTQGFAWGTDILTLNSNKLTFSGKYGEFIYQSSADELPEKCFQ